MPHTNKNRPSYSFIRKVEVKTDRKAEGGDEATGHGSDSNLGWPLSAMQHLVACLSNWAQPAPCFDIYLLCLFQGFYQGYWLMGGSWLVFNEVAGQCISNSNLWWYSVPSGPELKYGGFVSGFSPSHSQMELVGLAWVFTLALMVVLWVKGLSARHVRSYGFSCISISRS